MIDTSVCEIRNCPSHRKLSPQYILRIKSRGHYSCNWTSSQNINFGLNIFFNHPLLVHP